MNVSAHWKNLEIWIEDGIYFPDDSFTPMFGNPSFGYQPKPKTATSALKDYKTTLIAKEDASSEDSRYQVVAGEASWEGAGFVGLEDRKGNLIWLLSLGGAEPFTATQIHQDQIDATSGDYPDRFKWSIPIEDPTKLSVAAEKAA